jgi:arginyl-tRNA synthetase
VLGEDRKMYRTRAGTSVKLSDLLDEAVERAAAAIADKNPDITGDERASVARAVGIGAVKYADLANDRIKDYVFSFERMLAFEGNTGPYIQYAYARISKILRDAGPDAAELAAVVPAIAEPQERALAKALLGFDAAVHDTVDKLGPHRLCTYLFDLAQTFTAFYEACPVLKAGVSTEVRRSRLSLCALTASVLALGLGLLGIEAPERM